ncbi:MAG: bifunctional diguanylate cyclase/phosphodiesterase [Litorimonas sp.]
MDKTAENGDRSEHYSGARGQDAALSLMRAAPFRISDQTHLHFEPATQAADVLCSPHVEIPKIESDWTARISPKDARERQKSIRRLTWDGAEYKCVYEWRTYHGDFISIEEQGRRISGRGDTPTEIEGVIRNVTSRKRTEDRAAYLANHDDLTGLANLESLTRNLDHLAALSQRQKCDGALLRLRVTNLRDINEVYGFETGDRVLADLAKRLSQVVKLPDIIGRIKGADFALLLSGASQKDVQAISKRLFLFLENSPVKTPHGELRGEISIGSTQIPTQASNAEDALSQSLIAITQSAPSALCMYDDTMAVHAVQAKRDTTSQDILDAINQRRIQLAYQPIIDTKTSQLHHYECLLRLQRKDGELVSAGHFIMAAERLGLVHLLDRRALELASDALAKDPGIQLALNVSAATVKDAVAASDYITALKALGPRAEQITIELTETVALDDPALASAFSNSVRSLGCSFAIDDFGSGYTTFRNLMAIEADAIKIDGTLIEGVASDPNKQTFVRMMVDLAQTFGVETVAEMVDDRADADILRRLGVDYLQGFMFGVPSAAPSWQKRAS